MQIFKDFFNMSGYGFYIWSSYLFSFLLISILLFSVISRKKNIEKRLVKFNKKNSSENK